MSDRGVRRGVARSSSIAMRWMLVLVAVSGCSLAISRSRPREDGTCSGIAPAVVDGIATAALIALTVRSYRDNRCGEDGCHVFDPTGLYVVPTIGFAASLAWGIGNARACAAVQRSGRIGQTRRAP